MLDNYRFPAHVRDFLEATRALEVAYEQYAPRPKTRRWDEYQYHLVLLAYCASKFLSLSNIVRL